MGTQQLCLKWNKHYSNLLDISDRLLSTEALVDVTLACEGLCLKAHKLVLSACSPFFQAIFTENPCKHPIVIMKGVSYADLKAIVEFMYRGEVSVTRDQLSALLETAQMLQVRGLAEDSEDDVQSVEPSASASTQNAQSLNSVASASSSKQTDSPSHKRKKRKRRRASSGSDGGYSDSENQSSMKIEEPRSPEVVSIDGKEAETEKERASSPIPEQRASTSFPSSSQPSQRVTSQSSSQERQPSTSVPSEVSHSEVEVTEVPPSPEKHPEIKVEPVEVLEQCMDVGNPQEMAEGQGHSLESVLQQLPASFTLTPVLSEPQTVPESHHTRSLNDQNLHIRKEATSHHSRTLPEPIHHTRKVTESHHSRAVPESFHSRQVAEPHSLRTMPEPDMSVLVPFSISSESSAGSLHDNTSQDVMLNNVPFEDASSSSMAGPSHQDGAEGSVVLYGDSSVAAIPGPSGYQPDEQSSRQGTSQGNFGTRNEGTVDQASSYTATNPNKCIGRSVNNVQQLASRVLIKLPQKRYRCNVCNAMFGWRNNMYAHRKRAHPEFASRYRRYSNDASFIY